MKKILLIALAIVLISCKEEPKDYATLSGKITDKNSDSLLIRSRTYSKTIHVNEDGSFKDTLKVESGIYNLFDGKASTFLFLKNDANISLTANANELDKTITYKGKNSETSNYIAKKILIQREEFNPELLNLNEEAFKAKIEHIHSRFSDLLNNSENIDSTVYSNEKHSIDIMKEGFFNAYNQQKSKVSEYDEFIGKPSPEFVNYENYNGGTTSLKDLKGKYVYVDVWATWCGPCKREIPFLKEIETKYHDKNIEFVSISVDNGRGFKGNSPEERFAASKEGWKKMISDKNMSGIQLFADNGWKSDFVKGYKISGIPRFILIDPKGNIVDANAPRPSSPKLTELLDKLNI
ncbi:TlpA family protein disulfide reductase [Seonamhaeicola sp. MEBiC1930]|uniref:TlpA family protein disulfide reductase n=1 Tax=Seonamhaeicola sp. MEBiC01930 TaxID=2976768 RepID=UPI00324B2D75